MIITKAEPTKDSLPATEYFCQMHMSPKNQDCLVKGQGFTLYLTTKV